jgi:leucyl aminopeptidase
MNYNLLKTANPATTDSDCIIIPIFANSTLSDAAKTIDEASSGSISAFLKIGDFSGKKCQIHMLYNVTGINANRILLAGCGKQDDFDNETLTDVITSCATLLKKSSIKVATSWLSEGHKQQDMAVQTTVTTLSDLFYRFEKYKSKKTDNDDDSNDDTDNNSLCDNNEEDPEPLNLEEFTIVSDASRQALDRGMAIAEGILLTKNLANEPPNVCTPTYLAEIATEMAASYDSLSCKILEESDMEELGMGAFLSVSKGSAQAGKLIILNYQGGTKDQKPVALVGKGITFDTGGISIKPGARMDEMKFDMGGAAGVLGTVKAIAEMQLPINVVMAVAAAENMPSSIATRPGDIVTSMSGKTIEVLNTDAEGRMVLCDALTYVGKYDPEIVIDTATLTGACIVALGHHICGLLSNNDELADDIIQAGKDAQDEAWRLPMNKKYQKQLKSEFADMANIGGPSAGTITAGCFLSQFTEDYTWAHLDIAGTAWKGKAATGKPVPLLTQYLINRSVYTNTTNP